MITPSSNINGEQINTMMPIVWLEQMMLEIGIACSDWRVEAPPPRLLSRWDRVPVVVIAAKMPLAHAWLGTSYPFWVILGLLLTCWAWPSFCSRRNDLISWSMSSSFC